MGQARLTLYIKEIHLGPSLAQPEVGIKNDCPNLSMNKILNPEPVQSARPYQKIFAFQSKVLVSD